MIFGQRLLFFVFGILLYTSLFANASVSSYFDESDSYYLLIAFSCCPLFMGVFLYLKKSKTINLTTQDLYALVGLLIFACSFIHSPIEHLSLEHLLAFFISIAVYFLVRIGQWDSYLFGALVASTMFIELIWCWESIDLYNIRENSNNVKGTFNNVNLLAFYIIYCLVFLTLPILKINSSLLRRLLLVCVMLAGVFVIIISQSRGVLLALGCGGIYLVYGRYYDSGRRILSTTPNALKILLIILGGVFLAYIFQLKFYSSIGRVLIWRVSSEHLLDRPLLGFGIGSFGLKYPYWQGDFFAIGSHSRSTYFVTAADLSYAAFNEYIQLFVETGILGLGWFLLFVISIFRTISSNEYSIPFLLFKIGFLLTLAYSIVSYPLHSFPISILFFATAGMLVNMSPEQRQHINIGNNGSILPAVAGILLSTYLLIFMVSRYLIMCRWEEVKLRSSTTRMNVLLAYTDLYNDLNWCGPFLLDYGEALYNNAKFTDAISIITASRNKFVSEKGLFILANSLIYTKQYDQAEVELVKIKNILPNRIQPNFLLCQINLAKGDSVNARYYAQQVVDMPMKVRSLEGMQMKEEMSKLLMLQRK